MLALYLAARLAAAPRPSLPAVEQQRVFAPLSKHLKDLAAQQAPAPLLLTDAPDVPRWSPEALARSQIYLSSAYVSPVPVFGPYYDDHWQRRPLVGVDYVGRRAEYVDVNLSAADFFAGGTDKARPYVHYSGEVERDLPKPMLDELLPLDAEITSVDAKLSSVNLWLGRRGSVVPCHYDSYHNALVQLHGTKRVLLAPPSALALARSFPFMHPSYAQCRNLLGELPLELLAAAGGVEATLRPGDVLYLPPMWIHETYTDGDSVAVNAWTDWSESRAAIAMHELNERPLPSHASGNEHDLAVLIRTLSLRTMGDATRLAEVVWCQRYAPLVEAGELFDFSRNAGYAHLYENVCDTGEGDEIGVNLTFVDRVSRSASTMGNRTRVVWLANLAEMHAVEFLMLSADRAGLHGGVTSFWRALHACAAAECSDPAAAHMPMLHMGSDGVDFDASVAADWAATVRANRAPYDSRSKLWRRRLLLLNPFDLLGGV